VAVVLVGRLVPWPGAVVAPAVVCYAQEAIVRTDSAGFVAEIHVESGQWVRAGDVLAILANLDLEHELASLEVALAESQLKRRVHVGHGESAKAQVERETLRTLENRLEEKRQQVARLVVRAPCSGNVIGRNLQWKCGTYLPQGSELVTIGREDGKEIRISIAQQDLDTFGRCLGEPVRIGLPGRGDLQAPLTLIEPRASKRLWDAALCARHGGPLPVRPRSDTGRDVGDPQYELLTPRFTGIVALPPAQSLQLCAGQRAEVSVAGGASLGGHLHRVIADWVDARLHAPRREVALRPGRDASP
jgi:putative peptide zinc metalloprotease protein